MNIIYRTDAMPAVEAVIDLYESAGLPRPTHDKERMRKMTENSDLIITAWEGDLLVGVSRCITDWCWSCYLSDLAVRREYQKKGIGKELIRLTKETVGEQSTVLLLSVSTALEYYPKVGLQKENAAFIIYRKEWRLEEPKIIVPVSYQ